MVISLIIFICIINWIIVSVLEPSEFRKITRLIVTVPPFAIVLAIIEMFVIAGILIKDGFIALIKFVKG